ncbi:MAG: tetratricopeptide repeat protein [Candidatus Anammoxibacter sp.]
MNYDLNPQYEILNIRASLLRKAASVFFVFLLFFFLPCKYTASFHSQDVNAAQFSLAVKKKIALFPIRNNTDIPALQESIPDLLRAELFRSGFFDIVERNVLYKTIWRIAISDILKIENTAGARTGAARSGNFQGQEVDLFSRLNRVEIERVLDFVDADYIIKGSVNKFGDLIRIDFELLDVGTKKTLEIMSAEANDVESIPIVIKGFIPIIKKICVRENIDEIADGTVGKYRAGLVTFETVVAELKDVVLMVPESVYANTLLLILYKEKGLKDNAIDVCKSIVSTLSQHNAGALEVFARLGVDPFEILANFYDEDDRLKAAADVYAKAIKTMPSNTYRYYKNLGVIFRKQKKLEDAIDAFKHSIELNLRDFDAHYQLGIAYEMGGQDAEAVAEYRKCLKYSGGIKDGLPIDVVKRKIKELGLRIKD